MTNVLFITNILCRHQVGLWDPFSNFEDINFTYLCTRNPKIEISIRYKCDEPRDYVLDSWNLSDIDISKLIKEADVIFYGSVEDNRVSKILVDRKNAFIISENYSKYDYHDLYKLRGIRTKLFFKKNISNILENVNKQYIFCASSHTGHDFLLAGAKKDSTLKFGYFPHYRYATNTELNNKKISSIIYIGRNEKWKHPEVATFFLDKISKYGEYSLSVYGEGLDDYFSNDKKVKLHDSISNKKLTNILIETNIFIFPSDRREGWGCVLGEAMAAGCICFANIEAGSTRYLINDGVNGFTFKSKNELNKKIKKYLALSDAEIHNMRIGALNTMKTSWSGNEAAKRLHTFVSKYCSGEKFSPFDEGPLSLDI